MNKLLAFAQKRIPYIPELKSLCDDSIPATILMMQMEYWFASRPDGFYKFLKPCEHERYHVGDSWTEELQFSEHEFRSSFDKIGVRYKSKTQLEQVPYGEDVFQGQYYLSYFDTRKGMTVYLRNHALIDEKLDALLEGFRAQPMRKREQVIDSNKDANIQSPEIESFNLRRLKKSISGDEKIQFAYKGTDITTQDYKHRTAAEEGNSKIESAPVEKTRDPNFAAAVVLKKREEDFVPADRPEPVIGKSITKNQQTEIGRMIASCEPDPRAQEKLQAEIEFCMLDEGSFTQAGNDFVRKLNTIKKCLREGRWTTPSKFAEKAAEKISNVQQTNQIREQELEGECAHWKYIAGICQKKNKPEHVRLAMEQHEKAQVILRNFHEAQIRWRNASQGEGA